MIVFQWLSTVESAQLSLNLLTKYAESIDSSRRYMLTNDSNIDRGIFLEFCQNSGGLERISGTNGVDSAFMQMFVSNIGRMQCTMFD
jgi:hypothetical protein